MSCSCFGTIKTMKLKYLSLMILVALVFITSCTSNSPSSSSQGLSGFKALVMELRIPKSDFFVSDSSTDFEIPFNIIIKNEGTSTVSKNNAVLQISGFDPSLFSKAESKVVIPINQDIEGRSTNRAFGDIIVFSNPKDIDLKLTKEGIKNIKDRYEFDLFYNLCYKYKTSLSSSIKLNPLNTLNLVNDVSNQNSVSYSQGQGAPLAVTRIDVFSTNNKVLLTIYVEKKSGKLIYYTDSFSTKDCGSVEFSSRNKFKVSKASLSGKIAEDCVGKDKKGKEFYLDESGRGQITCTFSLDDEINSPITSILSLDLEYYVFDSISQRFSVRKI